MKINLHTTIQNVQYHIIKYLENDISDTHHPTDMDCD